MCGICGFSGIEQPGLIESMAETLRHRGPDNSGFAHDGDVALGHRRLSIIDVAGGQQPLTNEDESLTLICNGEIYNYQELREGLIQRGHRFKTRSDSEVILHLYEEEGSDCLTRMNGMFAIALFDHRTREIFLARDRIGIKPLYYSHAGDRFLFASEMKALLEYRGLETEIDPLAIDHYLALRYVPGPGTLFNSIKKLPAAHYAIFGGGRLQLVRYWQPELYGGDYALSDREYEEGFRECFERSVRRRLVSEVPVGAYLSGGLDSSVIVAAFSKLIDQPVRTFSVGFGFQHDEVEQASATADFLGCEHTQVNCRADDLLLLPTIVHHLDEPIGDPIVVPMYLLAREAKKQVTVILTGEGADEMLGGYLFHKALLRGRQLATLLPGPLRRTLLDPAVRLTPAQLINLAFDYPASLGKRGKRKLVDFLDLLGPGNLSAAYHHLISLFDPADVDEIYTPSFREAVDAASARPEGIRASANGTAPLLNRILHLQFEHWLQDDILMKQDKMSMAHAIEGRVPFLDHELVEYSLRLPPRLKISRSVNKAILRSYAADLLPTEVANRKKAPFYLPLDEYLLHSGYRELVADTLSASAVKSRGLFRPAAIEALRRRATGGEFLYDKQVFSLVALELWFRDAVDH